MAFGSQTNWEVNNGGSDTANGGGFDPGVVFNSTLVGTFCNTSSPVVTSTSYSFVSGDVGAWLFIASGTNWIPGFYQIPSVSSGVATLQATLGSAVLYNNGANSLNLVPGCAYVASPSGAWWGLDYSRGTSPGIVYTDLVIDGTTNTKFTSAANPVGPNIIGNFICISGGASFTKPQTVEVLSVSGTTATCDKSLGTVSGVGGRGGLGGACASPGFVGGIAIANNAIFIKNTGTTYAIGGAVNAAGGWMRPPGGTSNITTGWLVGYQNNRFIQNFDTPPTLRPSVNGIILINPLFGNFQTVRNIAFINPSGFTSCTSIGISNGNGIAADCTSTGYNIAFEADNDNSGFINCSATNFSTYGFNASTAGDYNIFCVGCVAYSWTNILAMGFTGWPRLINCIAANGRLIGFRYGANGSMTWANCLAYNIASGLQRGFDFVGANNGMAVVNCLAVNCGTYGFYSGSTAAQSRLINCAAFGNNSGNVDPFISNVAGSLVNFVTLTADPTTNGPGNNFALNNIAGGGAMLRAAGFPKTYQGISTTSYLDIGPVQHPDPPAYRGRRGT